MTSLELQKEQLLKEIDSEELLGAVKEYIRKFKSSQSAPSRYSVEEMKNRLKQGKTDAQRGAYKSQADMRKKHSE